MSDNLSLFDQPNTGDIPLTRTPDHQTSHQAAGKVIKGISALQESLLAHIKMMQPVTALELEELDVYAHLAPSTVRKRISELAGRGKIIGCGEQPYKSKRTGRVSKGLAWSVQEFRS